MKEEKVESKNVDKDIEDSIDKEYGEVLKSEQKRQESESHMKVAQEFDSVRKMGFATRKDVDDVIKGTIGALMEKMEKLEKDNKALREFVLRAKAQGLNSGALDETVKKKETNELLEGFFDL